jgi:hypothetical protein
LQEFENKCPGKHLALRRIRNVCMYVSRMDETINVYRILDGKFLGKWALRKLRI